jgi:AhpD family alkylhydroperoxidase
MTLGLVAMIAGGLAMGEVAIAQKAADKTKPAAPMQPTAAMPMTADATIKDIEQTIGFVPQFFHDVAATQLPSLWSAMKTFQMNDATELDARTKELIALGVASQIPCEYCIAFHTEAAKHHGATDQQVREAIGMASVTRMVSTVLNGTQVDKQQFRKDVTRLFGEKKKMPAQARRGGMQ